MTLKTLQKQIVGCGRCPRLIEHCATVAQVKRRAYQDWAYWGRPVPSFGDPEARVLIIGLAPGAHGANRTGRMFTGDSSGDFLYRALHETGFASQPESRHVSDGLVLHGAYITASAHCAPPDNKPAREEIIACRVHLEWELALLRNIRVVVALGRIAFDNYLAIKEAPGFTFEHNRVHVLGPDQPLLISSYHPSQQNTSTRRLTREMLRAVFEQARECLD